MLHFDVACVTLPCLQEHLCNVYFRRKPSSFVEEYEVPCKSCADRWNRVISGGPLLELEDIVRIFPLSEELF